MLSKTTFGESSVSSYFSSEDYFIWMNHPQKAIMDDLLVNQGNLEILDGGWVDSEVVSVRRHHLAHLEADEGKDRPV